MRQRAKVDGQVAQELAQGAKDEWVTRALLTEVPKTNEPDRSFQGLGAKNNTRGVLYNATSTYYRDLTCDMAVGQTAYLTDARSVQSGPTKEKPASTLPRITETGLDFTHTMPPSRSNSKKEPVTITHVNHNTCPATYTVRKEDGTEVENVERLQLKIKLRYGPNELHDEICEECSGSFATVGESNRHKCPDCQPECETEPNSWEVGEPSETMVPDGAVPYAPGLYQDHTMTMEDGTTRIATEIVPDSFFHGKTYSTTGPFSFMLFKRETIQTNWGYITDLVYLPAKKELRGVLNKIPIVFKFDATWKLTSNFCPVRGSAEQWSGIPTGTTPTLPKCLTEETPVFAFKQYSLNEKKFGSLTFSTHNAQQSYGHGSRERSQRLSVNVLHTYKEQTEFSGETKAVVALCAFTAGPDRGWAQLTFDEKGTKFDGNFRRARSNKRHTGLRVRFAAGTKQIQETKSNRPHHGRETTVLSRHVPSASRMGRNTIRYHQGTLNPRARIQDTPLGCTQVNPQSRRVEQVYP